MNQRMYGSAEFQVTAHPDGQVFKGALFPLNRQEVSQGLGRVIMSAVPGIDDRHRRAHGCNHRCAFFWVAHGDDIGIAANHTHRIGNAFALGSGAVACTGEANHTAAKLQHSRFKAQTCTGGRLKKERRQFFAVALFCIFIGICNDIIGGGNQIIDFFYR